MGLFTRGLLRIFEEVAERAEGELYNEEGVREELTQLYAKLEAGEITLAEFDDKEVELVQRLEEIEERNRSRGGGRGR